MENYGRYDLLIVSDDIVNKGTKVNLKRLSTNNIQDVLDLFIENYLIDDIMSMWFIVYNSIDSNLHMELDKETMTLKPFKLNNEKDILNIYISTLKVSITNEINNNNYDLALAYKATLEYVKPINNMEKYFAIFNYNNNTKLLFFTETNSKEKMVSILNKAIKILVPEGHNNFEYTLDDLSDEYKVLDTYINDDWAIVTNNQNVFNTQFNELVNKGYYIKNYEGDEEFDDSMGMLNLQKEMLKLGIIFDNICSVDSDEFNEISDGYPFNQSFDEIEIPNWVNKYTENLDEKLINEITTLTFVPEDTIFDLIIKFRDTLINIHQLALNCDDTLEDNYPFEDDLESVIIMINDWFTQLEISMPLNESAYHEFFKEKLEEYGVNSPSELNDEDIKKFFNEMKNFTN